MHFKTNGQDNPIAVIDEYELHNLLCTAQQTFLSQIIEEGSELEEIMLDTCGMVSKYEIVPKKPELFSAPLARAWEDRLSMLITLMQLLDSRIHTDAEYTC